MARVEVLDKVKQLFLIPELECMTITQVADYFGTDSTTIRQQYQRNKDEFDSDGTHIKKMSEFQISNVTSCHTRKVTQQGGGLVISLEDGTEIKIPNCGTRCFPKRAILRMGMLLRDSRVLALNRCQTYKS